MGYYDAEVTGRPYDGGIDGTVYVDPLKTDFFRFQAKNWGSDIDTDEIKNFVASFRPQLKGLFVTTSKFQAGVTKYLEANRDLNVILIDGDNLTELMFKYNVGIAVNPTHGLKGIDRDYFAD